MSSRQPVVLMTNDDGPPSSSSPNIYSFVKCLQQTLGWDVRVVIPDCQKSWVGKAYVISDVVEASYFYPREPDGLEGDITTKKRPLKEGETMEWVLLTGTPATCSNIALYNIYPGEIDLVISGPNHGKNASAAFALSSGTIGAALSSSLSSYPSIALSYGVVARPVPAGAVDLANEISVEIVRRLWDDWGVDDSYRAHFDQRGAERALDAKGRVHLYCVNVPLITEKLVKEKRKVWITRLWRNGYGSLFKDKRNTSQNNWETHKPAPLPTSLPNNPQSSTPSSNAQSSAGPAAAPKKEDGEEIWKDVQASKGDGEEVDVQDGTLRFFFAPEMKPMVFPEEHLLRPGTDMWAMHHGFVSVTPMQACFAEPGLDSMDLKGAGATVEEMDGAREWPI